MNIVFLTEHIFGTTIGGVESHIYYLGKELARQGHTVDVLICLESQRNNASTEIVYQGASTNERLTFHRYYRRSRMINLMHFTSKFKGRGIGMAFALLRKLATNVHAMFLHKEIKKLRPDFIHQHDYLANIALSKWLARDFPVVMTNHTGQYLYLEKTQLGRCVQKLLMRHYKLIISPSEELRPKDSRSYYLSNGADDTTFRPVTDPQERSEVEALRQQINPQGKCVFICPRRWAPTKGIIYLAEAMLQLEASVQDKILILFAGSDSDDFPAYKNEVLNILSRCEPNSYRLLGNLDHEDLRRHFNLSDVCVIPSLMEATSLAAMEAMACGVPVLSTNVGGMPDVVANSELGWLIAPGDSRLLADSITKIAKDMGALLPMKVATRAYISENKSWRAIGIRTVELYRSAI